MIKKNIIISILYLFLISNFAFADDYNDDIQNNQIEEYVEEQIDNVKRNKKKKNKHKKKNKTKKNKKKDKKGFFKTYILPKENQIFCKKKHLISLFGGIDSSKFYNVHWLATKSYGDVIIYDDYSYYAERKNGEIAINYSLPTKFWWFNGRFSVGLFSWIMKQNIENYYHKIETEGNFFNYTLGFEMVEEIIFGHQNLYFTFGFGVSYQIVVSSSVKTNNDYYQSLWEYRNPKILWNNSNFNWVIKASIGHKFDCGLIIELNWKHYSNGNLGNYNWGLNFFGGTIGYVF